jgi:hypothetical protein
MQDNYLWLVMVALPFNSLKIDTNLGINALIKIEEGEPTHFCPIFENKEDADKWSGGKYEVVRLNKPKNNINYH